MKVGVFSTVFQQLPFEQMLDRVVELGLDSVEIGTGNWPGNAHCDVDLLLNDAQARSAFAAAISSRGLTISALSQHGNPVHPDASVAAHDHDVFVKTVRLAGELGVPVVNGFSGCPGGNDGSTTPNWVTCAWPPEFRELLDWQWNSVLVPYWEAQIDLLDRHNVNFAVEMHPGYNVYNPETLLRLRAATSDRIGANYDPSHLFWQGIDHIESIKALCGAIFHVHAKDTYLDRANIAVNGVLDSKPYTQLSDRSWYFRSVGFGQGEHVWKEIIAALRLVGYDYVMSIEHEDGMMSIDEGLVKAASVLKSIVPREPAAAQWWA
jgi:sugar phosphate isomerase/epimerase